MIPVAGEGGHGVLGFDTGGLELELSLEVVSSAASGLLRAAWRGDMCCGLAAAEVSEWLSIGDWVPEPPPLRPPCTIEIRGANTLSASSSGPSSVLGRPRFFFISPLMLAQLLLTVLLFSWPPGAGLLLATPMARPIIVMGGGPALSRDTEAEAELGAESLSSPETSARPFTLRFSAVFSSEESRSWTLHIK